MTTREDMIEAAARVIGELWDLEDVPHSDIAAAVLHAVLPQIATVEQLEALPETTRLVGTGGATVQVHVGWVRVDSTQRAGASSAVNALHQFGPLTVVWQPAPVTEAVR